MKKFLLLIFCAVLSIATHAEKVTEQEAMQKAQQFLQGKKIKQDDSASHRLRRAPKTNVTSDAYYVFNVEDNGGFVIVSGDDRTEEILGYADKGTIDINNMPDNLKTWLGVYETAIKSIANKPVKRSQRRIIAHETIEPLLDCQWGQGAPYNAQCPIFNEQNCVTGCVATAMAQLMYYHKWPESVGTIDGYQDWWRNEYLSELPSTTFNWSQMKACYLENESADEVAKLMRYCGQAVGMQYGIYESGVSSSAEIDKVLTDVFDYDKSIRILERVSFVNTSWQEMIYRELADKRPVYYDAFNGYNAGHAFLCDGYDNGYFHINWGWNGDCDGYFLLSILDPDNTDDPMNAFSVGQRAFVNVRKNSGYGADFDDGCFVYRIIDEDKVWLYSTTDFDPYEWHDEKPYDRKAESIIIPSIVTHEGRQYKVTNLGHEYAINIHWDYSYIQTESPPVRLVLPETLEQIDEINFYGPDEITIPKNVYTIGPQGIYGQEPLKRILVEEGNEFFKSIDGVLYSKDGKTICVYPQGKAIETLYVAEGVKTIAAKAFAGCFLIKHIVLPESVEGEIPAYTFNGCGSLESISLPDGITSIGAVAFDGCFRLKHIDLPKNLKFIGPFSFMDCPLLEEITIPGTVEAIACEAFRTTNDFWTNYPLLVDELGLDGQHSMLRKITVQSAYPIEVYDGEPFDDYVYENATLYVPTGSKEFYQAAPSWKNFKHIEEIDMPDAVMQKTSQFLTYSITGENTVTVTGAKRELYGHLTLPTTVDIDNKEYNITGLEQSALINQAFSWLTIPDGFESIGYNAVGQNWNLTRIDLPSTIKYDGYYFIYDNPSLAEITLAEGNPYFTLKDGVLYTKDMATLVAHPAMLKDKELIIPNGVTRLEMFSLADCKYLEDVTIPNTVQEMSYAFYGLSQDVSIKSITVRGETPPAGWAMFDTPDNAIIDNATLYVPTGCKAVYQEHPEWGKFKHIEEKKDTPGDVNGDGKVNITDAVGIVNYLLGNPSDGFIEAAADVNNDGSITITDAVAVVNMILNQGNQVRNMQILDLDPE